MQKTMWRCSAFFAVLACVAVGGRGHGSEVQAARAQAPIGPLGHWKGDDGGTPPAAADASGNGFHGTYSAGAAVSTTVPATKFQSPGSIQLDGATGMVSVPDSPALRITGDITIAFWKRRTANVKDWSRMVGKGNGAQRNFGVWEAPEGDGRVLFQQYDAGGRPVIDLFSPAATALNTWVHITCVVSVNSAALYFNGALVANGTRNGEPGTAADPLTFGHAGYHAFWPGQLDDIRIYDRALSMSEIVYLAGGQGPPAAPTGLAAAGAGTGQVALKWTASPTVPPAGTATYYLVKRSLTPGKDYVTVGSLITATTYTDATAEAGKTYAYVVTAVNTGGESAPSNEATAASQPK